MNTFHEAARADLMISGGFVRNDVAAVAVSRLNRSALVGEAGSKMRVGLNEEAKQPRSAD
jgi:hypothetical protein